MTCKICLVLRKGSSANNSSVVEGSLSHMMVRLLMKGLNSSIILGQNPTLPSTGCKRGKGFAWNLASS